MLIGILALQGSFKEHATILEQLSIDYLLVKTKEELAYVDGLIIPGGESTTIGRLLRRFDLFDLLKKRLNNGMPCYGTCAGLILLANKIIGEKSYLNAIDITVLRNAYGRQLGSFEKMEIIPVFSNQAIPLVFIRAPWIETVGVGTEILATVDNHIVAARNDNILVTSFHPELTNDLSVHRYFLKMVK